MAQPAGLQLIRDFSGGMVTESSDSLTPPNVMRLVQNMDTDVLGSLRVRKGTTAIGSQAQDGKNCLGIFQFKDSGSGANSQQVVAMNNSGDTQATLKYNNAGTWTNITGGTTFTAGAKFRFATFADYLFIVNSAFDAVKSWAGTGSLGTTNLTSVPVGKYINVFKSRLYIAATSANPDRVYFSSVQTAGAITWDTTYDYLDINPSDGMNITALANNGTLLLIFKERAMYRWNGSSTDANLVVDVGTTSQESVATRTGRTYFYNPNGFYVTDGGYPVCISLPIQRWIDAIPAAYYDDVSAVTDNDHYYASVGDLTVDGIAYSNVVLSYAFASQHWTVRTYPEEFRGFANYVDSSGNYKIMAGNDDGDVQDFDLGDDDDGTPISYRVRTKKMDFGSYAYKKKFSDVFMFGEKLPGAKMFVQSDDNSLAPVALGLVGWFRRVLGLKKSARYFVFEVGGFSSDGQGLFEGFEITDLTFDGYVD